MDTLSRRVRKRYQLNRVAKLLQESVSSEHGIEKSSYDHRIYKEITLENQLQVIIISDSLTQHAAASLSVHVGRFNDPEEIPGLSHLLEHAILMGTTKFPSESDYDNYISSNGGQENAWTSDEKINFHFTIRNENLQGALDRFSQMFISPLLKKEAIEREIHSVNAEFINMSRRSSSKIRQVYREIANPKHPYSKWGIGNEKSLRKIPTDMKIDIAQALRLHFDRFYSANIMKLVLLGNDSVENLEEDVVKFFSEIPNKDINIPYRYLEPAYLPEQLGLRIDVVPSSDSYQIEMQWVLESATYANDFQTLFYTLSYLFGDEGNGSIISLLRNKGYASNLRSGQFVGDSSFSSFGLQITCIDGSIKNHLEEIVHIVYSYIDLLKAKIDELLFVLDELSEMQLLRFKYPPSETILQKVTSIADRMHGDRPVDRIISSEYVFRHDKNTLSKLESILSCFKAENMILCAIHDEAEAFANKIEGWFGTKYGKRSLRKSEIWNHASWREYPLLLPKRNPYIPKATNTIKFFDKPRIANAPKNASPLVIHNVQTRRRKVFRSMDFNEIISNHDVSQEMIELDILSMWPEGKDVWRCPALISASLNNYVWFKQDLTFCKPHSLVGISIYTNHRRSLLDQVMLHLFVRMMQEFLLKETFYASNAGYDFSLNVHNDGLRLELSGFSEKILELLKVTLNALSHTEYITPVCFERMKPELINKLENQVNEDPGMLAEVGARMLLTENEYYLKGKLAELKTVTYDEFFQFTNRVLEKISYEMFLYGNMKPNHARKATAIVKKCLKPKSSIEESVFGKFVYMPQQRTQNYCMQISRKVNASGIFSCFILGNYSRKLMAASICFSIVVEELFYDIIRTQEQLGYSVYSSTTEWNGVILIYFKVLSNRANPFSLDERIEKFIRELEEEILNLSEDTLKDIIDSQIHYILQTVNSTTNEFYFWFEQIKHRKYDFDKRIEELRAFKDLNKGDLLEIYFSFLSIDAPNRRKLVSGIISADHAEDLFQGKQEESMHLSSSILLEHVLVSEKCGKILAWHEESQAQGRRRFNQEEVFMQLIS